jgi:dTDP-4-dehydrorhamnose reductase
MKILVTGSNGLLGQKLTRTIQQDPSNFLIATGKRDSVLPIGNGCFIRLDITDAEEVYNQISHHRPDVVIHTAAMTNVDQCEQDHEGCWKVNVDATKTLVSACEQYGVHLINLSTDFVFDGSHGPLDESEKTGPVNFYGKSKESAEEAVKKSTGPWSIIRTVLVYGLTRDMSRSNIVLWVKDNLEQGKPIKVVHDQWRTPTLAEDLATGCYLAAKKKATGIYHISGEDYITPYDIAIQTADYFELDKSLITPVDSGFLKQPARRPSITGFIIEKAKRELGYAPHSFQKGIGILAQQIKNPELA